MKKKILLIDENVLDYENDINVLKTEYDVEAIGYIDTASYLLLEKKIKYDLIVLDIMMPTFGLFDLKETSDGLKTGLVFYEKKLKKLDLPVLFWSWNTAFEEEINAKNWTKTKFLLKDTEEKHLLEGVNNFLKELKKQWL